jgi:hypothetical protein
VLPARPACLRAVVLIDVNHQGRNCPMPPERADFVEPESSLLAELRAMSL